MMRHRVLLVAWGITFAAGTASAQNTTPATALATAVGQVRSVSATASTSYYYDYSLKAGRSYAALCWNDEIKGAFDDASVWGRCTVSIRNTADAAVGGLSFYSDEPSAIGGNWFLFTPAISGNYLGRATSDSSPGRVRVVLVETTLFSPWFFVSPGGGYDSYVEMKNTTVRTVNVTVTALAPGGTTAGAPATRAIPAGGNTFVTVGGDMGASGSGGLQITTDGPPGAIVANVTTLSALTGLSFDAPCQPRMQWSLFQ